MSLAAYNTEVRKGGDPVSVVDAPTEMLGADGRVFRITNSSRRLISPLAPLAVKNAISGDPVPVTGINFMDGVILIDDAVDGEDGIEIDYYYIPLEYIGGAKDYSLELGGDLLDNTAFHSDTEQSGGNRTRQYGLSDITLSVSKWDESNRALRNAKLNKDIVFVSVKPGGAGSKLKATGWFAIETADQSGEVGGLEEESLSFMPAMYDDISEEAASLTIPFSTFSFVIDYSTAETALLSDEELAANYFPGYSL